MAALTSSPDSILTNSFLANVGQHVSIIAELSTPTHRSVAWDVSRLGRELCD